MPRKALSSMTAVTWDGKGSMQKEETLWPRIEGFHFLDKFLIIDEQAEV
jgi:hypothetical protein